MEDQIKLPWFKHDANARYDDKLVAAKLLFMRKYGFFAAPEPYSIYFQILESMVDNKGIVDYQHIEGIIYNIWGMPPNEETRILCYEKVTWIIKNSGLLQPCGVVLEQNSNTTKFCSNRLSTQLQHIFNKKSNKVRGGLLSAISRKNTQLKRCRDNLKREELVVDLQLLQERLKEIDNHSSSTVLPTEPQQKSTPVPVVFQHNPTNIDKIREDKRREDAVEIRNNGENIDFLSGDVLSLGLSTFSWIENREWFGKKFQLRLLDGGMYNIMTMLDRLIIAITEAGKTEDLKDAFFDYIEKIIFQIYPEKMGMYQVGSIEKYQINTYLPNLEKS